MGVNFCSNVREIKHYFNIQGIRKKEKKKGAQKKGGGGVKIHPFHLPWIRAWGGRVQDSINIHLWQGLKKPDLYRLD